MKQTIITPIVKRALLEPVTAIGQLTAQEKRELTRAVNAGYLSKGRGGPFPLVKTVYAHPGFDFAADRAYQYRQFQLCQALAAARGIFPRSKRTTFQIRGAK